MISANSSYRPPEAIFRTQVPLVTHVSLDPMLDLLCQRLSVLSGSTISSDKDSEPIVDQPKRAKARKRPGRKVSDQSLILRKFLRMNKKRRSAPPKLENIRYRVMRSLKKVVRRLATDKTLKPKGLLQFALGNVSSVYWKEELATYIAENTEALLDFADVQNGPKVDQCVPNVESQFSTYNNRYLEWVFEKEEVRVAYQLFAKLVFADQSPDALNALFRVRCCRSQTHDSTCQAKWTEFRSMVESYFGLNVAVQPRVSDTQ